MSQNNNPVATSSDQQKSLRPRSTSVGRLAPDNSVEFINSVLRGISSDNVQSISAASSQTELCQPIVNNSRCSKPREVLYSKFFVVPSDSPAPTVKPPISDTPPLPNSAKEARKNSNRSRGKEDGSKSKGLGKKAKGSSSPDSIVLGTLGGEVNARNLDFSSRRGTAMPRETIHESSASLTRQSKVIANPLPTARGAPQATGSGGSKVRTLEAIKQTTQRGSEVEHDRGSQETVRPAGGDKGANAPYDMPLIPPPTPAEEAGRQAVIGTANASREGDRKKPDSLPTRQEPQPRVMHETPKQTNGGSTGSATEEWMTVAAGNRTRRSALATENRFHCVTPTERDHESAPVPPAASPFTGPKNNSIPPIFVENVNNWVELYKTLTSKCTCKPVAPLLGRKIKIKCSTANDFHATKAILGISNDSIQQNSAAISETELCQPIVNSSRYSKPREVLYSKFFVVPSDSPTPIAKSSISDTPSFSNSEKETSRKNSKRSRGKEDGSKNKGFGKKAKGSLSPDSIVLGTLSGDARARNLDFSSRQGATMTRESSHESSATLTRQSKAIANPLPTARGAPQATGPGGSKVRTIEAFKQTTQRGNEVKHDRGSQETVRPAVGDKSANAPYNMPLIPPPTPAEEAGRQAVIGTDNASRNGVRRNPDSLPTRQEPQPRVMHETPKQSSGGSTGSATEEWTTVAAGKRTRGSVPLPASSALATENRFDCLTPTAGDHEPAPIPPAASPFTGPKNNSIPPIFVENVNNWVELYKKLTSKCTCKPVAQLLGRKIKIKCSTVNDFHATKTILSEESINFFTYRLATEKKYNLVIRNLPVDLGTSDISESLAEQGLLINKITQMKTTRPTKRQAAEGIKLFPLRPLTLFQIEAENLETAEKASSIRFVCGLKASFSKNSSLAEQGLLINKITQMKTTRPTKRQAAEGIKSVPLRPLPLFQIEAENLETAEKASSIKFVCGLKVTIEKFKPTNGPPQCKRCQIFGHIDKACNMPAKCVRCGEGHMARNLNAKELSLPKLKNLQAVGCQISNGLDSLNLIAAYNPPSK
ncbi:hypothetical protein J437_LFUL019227, partial [Ladona fulva]